MKRGAIDGTHGRVSKHHGRDPASAEYRRLSCSQHVDKSIPLMCLPGEIMFSDILSTPPFL